MNEEKIRKSLIELYEDLKWFSENFSRISKKYSNKWIAIKNKKIIAYSENYEELVKKLEEMKCEDALIRWIEPKNIVIVY